MVTAGRNAVTTWIATCLATCLAACTASGSGTNDAPSSAHAGAPGIVIGQVVTHDAKVAILASARTNGAPHRELRVVVRKIDGTMIADGITLSELRATNPDLYEVVTSASASNLGTTLDATLDLAHLN